jgi:hypothetical protein
MTIALNTSTTSHRGFSSDAKNGGPVKQIRRFDMTFLQHAQQKEAHPSVFQYTPARR